MFESRGKGAEKMISKFFVSLILFTVSNTICAESMREFICSSKKTNNLVLSARACDAVCDESLMHEQIESVITKNIVHIKGQDLLFTDCNFVNNEIWSCSKIEGNIKSEAESNGKVISLVTYRKIQNSWHALNGLCYKK